jgi:hypothetical protein
MSSLKLNVQKSPKNKNTTTAHTKRADAVHNPIERLINVILRHMFFNSFCDCSNNTGFLIECNRM